MTIQEIVKRFERENTRIVEGRFTISKLQIFGLHLFGTKYRYTAYMIDHPGDVGKTLHVEIHFDVRRDGG